MKFISASIIVLYLVFTSLFYIQDNSKNMSSSLKPFVYDDAAQNSLKYSFGYDTTDNSLFVVRLVHNKIETAVHTFFSSVLRVADVPFLFGLSGTVSSPYQIGYRPSPLYLIELPLFIISLFYFLKKYKEEMKILKVLALLFVVSIGIVGLFTPALHPITIFPLVITTRVFISIGIAQLVGRLR